jgi:heme oxygenase (biliverdin-IX-beta and delta-forming)
MTLMEPPIARDESRVKRLRDATHAAHERLDKRIMSAEPFSSRDRYGLFVMVQHCFHRDIDALYRHPVLDALLPDLQDRRRLHLIVRDLGDLGMEAPASNEAPVFNSGADDIPTAIGWLYVAEGSNLGAASLLEGAAKLDLGENFGARHLAGHPEGRWRHWRTFTATIDAAVFSPDEERRVIAGATTAFNRVHTLVERFLSVQADGTFAARPDHR